MNAEADRLVEEEGVFTVIVLSHCGYEVEQAIARNATSRIGLVVGAHSHTFLYTGGTYRDININMILIYVVHFEKFV